ncbi:uncharacterized protein N7479_003512 [Penicillium vulpinum]|uniref:uncharacterized protein n=1 Tax=Penicillium vulpinum TaxID=29845 RepID=UPI0025466D6E|nr:uncharacterized protein N7479_003512 [Penicillium vulpinum]KAJ5963636.1 hypothetical protein N7479_003512 [Penicillium vulpinum]
MTTRGIVLAGRLGPRDVTAVGLVAANLLAAPLDMMTMMIKADATTVPIVIETTIGIAAETVMMIRTIEGEMEIGNGTGTAAIDLEMTDTAARGTRLTPLGVTEIVIVIVTLVGVVAMIRGRMFWLCFG